MGIYEEIEYKLYLLRQQGYSIPDKCYRELVKQRSIIEKYKSNIN